MFVISFWADVPTERLLTVGENKSVGGAGAPRLKMADTSGSSSDQGNPHALLSCREEAAAILPLGIPGHRILESPNFQHWFHFNSLPA